MRTKVMIMVIALLSLGAIIYANDSYYNENDVSFQRGYAAGFNHGGADQRAGSNFDYRHAPEYQGSGERHLRFDSERSLTVRLGYIEGYVDGYFRHSARFTFHDDFEHRDDPGYGNGDFNNGGFIPGRASVQVFTERGFRGNTQQFGVGRYAYLYGSLNDAIESIRLAGNVRVILFDQSNFRGTKIVLDRDSSDLRAFSGKAASMIVEQVAYGYR